MVDGKKKDIMRVLENVREREEEEEDEKVEDGLFDALDAM